MIALLRAWRGLWRYHPGRDLAVGGEPHHARVFVQWQWRNFTWPRIGWCWYDEREGWLSFTLSDGNSDPAFGIDIRITPGRRLARWLAWWERSRP